MKPKVILDTNSLLQILGAHSKYHHLLHCFLKNHFTLCISTAIMFEYEEILREKASPVAADFFLKLIVYSPNVVQKEPFIQFGLISIDPDDNKFVDCAIVSQADFLVTDDTHFKELQKNNFPPVQVISLDKFSEIMLSQTDKFT